MSPKEKQNILGIGLIIITILVFIWLNVISLALYEYVVISSFFAVILPTIVFALCIVLFIKLWTYIKNLLQNSNTAVLCYQSIFEEVEVGFIITSINTNKIITANSKMVELLGYRNSVELSKISPQNIWPNPNEWLAFFNKLNSEEKVANYIFTTVCQDGSTKELDIYAVYNKKTGYIVANAIDVTKSLAFTRDLMYQASLLDNIQESIIVIGFDEIIQFYNRQAEKLFKVSSFKYIKDAIVSVLPTYNNAKAFKIRETVISGNSWQGEYEFIINGEKRFFMNRIDPVIYYNETIAYVIMSTDITELVKTREKAEAANLAKSQFLANMSHEVRTPMIGILGAVDLLKQSLTTESQYNNISIIRECGEDLLSIINDILDVSKIEIGIVELNPENCSIYDLFNRTIAMVEPALKEKGLNFEVDLKAISDINLYLDHYKLRQILTNILFNAIKFTNQGTIKLKSYIDYKELHNELIIIVSDTGIGIPIHSLPYIFNPFSQVDNSTSREFGGTGLGLYICKKLVDLMGGRINVSSQISQGTEFTISLPVEISSFIDNINLSKDKHNIEDNNIVFIPRSILVVEDHELNQKIVCEMLKNFGFEVSTASNGLECLQILEDKSFDTILLDMQMPIMDGYDTAEMIRKNSSLSNIPIIAMTAHAMNGDREKCIASGCNSYIAKPFKAEELVEEINKHLNSYKAANTPANNNLFINELIPEFFQELYEMIKILKKDLSNRDLDKVKSISHDIKGTSGLYGFNNIYNLAAEIEKAAKEKNIPKIEILYRDLYQQYQEAVRQVS